MSYKLTLVACCAANIFAQSNGILFHHEQKTGSVNLIAPNFNRVREYINYAASTLCSSSKLRDWSCDTCSSVRGELTAVKTVTSHKFGTYGYVGVNHQTQSIIVSFRDTVNLQNVIEDGLLVPFPPRIGGIRGMLIHKGFYTATTSVFPEVRKLVKKKSRRNPDYKVIVIGHSLGGAMASISTIMLHHKLDIPFEQMELYTYGQPRTGNHVFANYLNQQSMVIARVTKEGDPVPLSVPRGPFYSHHHSEIFLPEGKTQPIYCSRSQSEDPKCSDKDLLPLLTTGRHFNYLGVSLLPNACSDPKH